MAKTLQSIYSNNIHTFHHTADAPFTMMPLPPILRRNDKAKELHVPDARQQLRGAHPRTQHVWKGTFMRSGRRTKASLLDYARAAAIFKTRTHMVATVRGSSSTTRTLSRMQSTPLLAISTTQTQRLTIDRSHPVARQHSCKRMFSQGRITQNLFRGSV